MLGGEQEGDKTGFSSVPHESPCTGILTSGLKRKCRLCWARSPGGWGLMESPYLSLLLTVLFRLMRLNQGSSHCGLGHDFCPTLS